MNKYHNSLLDLTAIFASFNKKRNPDDLIEKILRLAIKVAHAEGGTIYLVTSRKTLFFKLFINEVIDLKPKDIGASTLNAEIPLFDKQGNPTESHVCCHAFHQQKMVHLADAYSSMVYDFEGLKAFDKAHNYHSKSILTIPIIGNRQDVIAILQLINARDSLKTKRIKFSGKVQKTVEALAAITGLQIDNLQLIENLSLQVDAANRAQIEKDRLLRDLHDGIGSRLTKASIDLQTRSLSPSEHQKVIDGALDEMRQIFNNYIHFDDSLLKMMQLLVEQYQDLLKLKRGCSLRYKYWGSKVESENLPRVLVVNLMQVLREFLTNCLKHSSASIINIALIITEVKIDLVIIENRTKKQTTDFPEIGNGGLGYKNIEYRVMKLLQGKIAFQLKGSRRITKIEISRQNFS